MLNVFKTFTVMVQKPTGQNIRTFQLDHGREFISADFFYGSTPGLKRISLQERIATLDTLGALADEGLKGGIRSLLTKNAWT